MTGAAAARPRPALRQELGNGARLLRLPGPLPWVGAGVWWQAGSRYEPPGLCGVAHCLEHLWLAGGPVQDRQIDALGGRINAETGRELCGLHGVAPAADAATLAELLATAFLHPPLDAAALAAERPAILAELAGLRSDPGERAVQRAIARAWAGHPAARPPEGTAAGLTRIDAAALADYRGRRLHGGRLTLVLLGDWPDGAADALVTPFARVPAGRPPSLDAVPAQAATEPVPGRACHLVWALPAATADAAAQMAELLAGGLASRLFRRLRRERVQLYDIRADTEALAGAALCLLTTTAPAGAGDDVAAVVEAELDGLAATGPGADELATATARRRAAEALRGLHPEDWMRSSVLGALGGDDTGAEPWRALQGPRVRVAEPL